MRRSEPQPWLNDIRFRLRFERGVRKSFSAIRINQTGHKLKDEVVYRLTVPVKGYEDRNVTVRIKNGYQPYPKAFVDGPEESPHRYADGSLCMWHPRDPADKTWIPADGLLTLIRFVQLHLFREAWWRETGEWVGEEADHAVAGEKKELK